MKKVTAMARVIDIFQTESLETCEQLLDAAQAIVKSRRTRNTATPKRRSAAAEKPEGGTQA